MPTTNVNRDQRSQTTPIKETKQIDVDTGCSAFQQLAKQHAISWHTLREQVSQSTNRICQRLTIWRVDKAKDVCVVLLESA